MGGRSRSRSRSRSRGGGGGGEEDRIQKLVDERQMCRRDRDFDRADQLRDELRTMGVNVDDTDLTWRGPDGMNGTVANAGGGGPGLGGAVQRRDGDWDCPSCGKMVFASKDVCFSCGTPRDDDRGSRGHDRSDGRGRDRYDDRRADRYDDRRGDRYDDRYDDRRDRRDERRRDRSDRYDDRNPDRYDDRRSDRYDDRRRDRYDDRRSDRYDDRRSDRYDRYDDRRR